MVVNCGWSDRVNRTTLNTEYTQRWLKARFTGTRGPRGQSTTPPYLILESVKPTRKHAIPRYAFDTRLPRCIHPHSADLRNAPVGGRPPTFTRESSRCREKMQQCLRLLRSAMLRIGRGLLHRSEQPSSMFTHISSRATDRSTCGVFDLDICADRRIDIHYNILLDHACVHTAQLRRPVRQFMLRVGLLLRRKLSMFADRRKLGFVRESLHRHDIPHKDSGRYGRRTTSRNKR